MIVKHYNDSIITRGLSQKHYLPLYPRMLNETADKTRGRRRDATNNAAAPSTSRAGSEFEMVSTVEDAMGLTS